MARFGQGMIQSLMNPSYAQGMNQVGLMAGSLPGRRRAAEEQRQKIQQQNAAQSALYQILNQNDPTDPKVQSAIMKLGLPPEEVQKALMKSQENNRAMQASQRADQASTLAKQSAARQEERLEMARLEAKYKASERAMLEEKAQVAQQQTEVAKAIEGSLERNPENLEKVILNIPKEHREFAREYAREVQSFKAEQEERKEKRAANAPITDEEWDKYVKVLGEEAKQYKGRRGARAALDRLFDEMQKKKILADTVKKQEALKDPTETEIENALALVNREMSSKSNWFGLREGQEEILTPEEQELFATAVAAKLKTDPTWIPSKENMIEFAQEIGYTDAPKEESGRFKIKVL